MRHVACALLIAVGCALLSGCQGEQKGVQIKSDPNAPAKKRLEGEARVDYLIGMLAQPSFGKKRAACQQLTKLGADANKAVPALEEELAKCEQFLAGQFEQEGEVEERDDPMAETYTPEMLELIQKALASVRGQGGPPAASDSTEG